MTCSKQEAIKDISMADKFDNLDKIYIRDLSLRCIIGINRDERREKQDIVINITLFADLSQACHSDDIEDTVDYKTIKKNIITAVEESSCYLLEHLAERIAQTCLSNRAVKRATVTIDKPGALRFARSVAIEITRDQKESD